MRICLVEQENIVRRTLEDFLTDLGHAVSVFNTLDDLSAALDQNPHSVDLIITDLRTANGKATFLLCNLHQCCSDVPIIVITTSDNILPAREAIQCGIYAYLHKPFRLAELELILVRLSETRVNGSLRDERTGLYQRPGFFVLAQQQLRVARRTNTRLAFLIADLNGTLSDDEGVMHQRGRIWTELGTIVRETFRESDILGRLTEKDCGVLLVDTSEEGAQIALSRLQENIEAHNARQDCPQKLSVHAGIAHYDPELPCSLDDLVIQADQSI